MCKHEIRECLKVWLVDKNKDTFAYTCIYFLYDKVCNLTSMNHLGVRKLFRLCTGIIRIKRNTVPSTVHQHIQKIEGCLKNRRNSEVKVTLDISLERLLWIIDKHLITYQQGTQRHVSMAMSEPILPYGF